MNQNFADFREVKWGVADGRQIPIKDLAIDHLVNILNWVYDRSSIYPIELYPLLEEEAKYRTLTLFAEGKPIPKKGDDGRWHLVGADGKELATKPKTDYSDLD